jgi:hypothetical protein
VIDLALVRVFLAALSGWLNHQQQDVIAYLKRIELCGLNLVAEDCV